MTESKMFTWLRMDQKEVLHSIRTAVAAVSSVLIARFCRLPESYWAAVTAIVIMQSTLGAAWSVSKQRFVGTALGAAMGALLTAHAAQNVALLTKPIDFGTLRSEIETRVERAA
jgi:uncharacterized membrane protein YccC